MKRRVLSFERRPSRGVRSRMGLRDIYHWPGGYAAEEHVLSPSATCILTWVSFPLTCCHAIAAVPLKYKACTKRCPSKYIRAQEAFERVPFDQLTGCAHFLPHLKTHVFRLQLVDLTLTVGLHVLLRVDTRYTIGDNEFVGVFAVAVGICLGKKLTEPRIDTVPDQLGFMPAGDVLGEELEEFVRPSGRIRLAWKLRL